MSESRFEWVSPTDDDVLTRLVSESCPQCDCDGILCRDEYKHAPAVVCETCEVPAARLWGDDA